MDTQLFGQYLIKSEGLRHDNVVKYLTYVTDAAGDLGIREDALYNINNPVILDKVVGQLKTSNKFMKRTKAKQQSMQSALELLVKYAVLLKAQ